MTKQRRRNPRLRPLDLFVALAGDIPLRDDKEAMSVPLFSLSKRKRTAPIEWRSSDGKRWVQVTANATHGMATIWDRDVLIWAVSQLNAAVERGEEVSRVLRFHPHDLLITVGREVGGDHYKALEAALNRLVGTTVETNIRVPGARQKAAFHLLEHWEHETDEATGRSKSMTLTLPQWIYDGVVEHRDVLTIAPAYFGITSGIRRWLYLLARRHAGKQKEGWRFRIRELHARSGSTQSLRHFTYELHHEIPKGIPEYKPRFARGRTGEELLVMVRDKARAGLPQRRDLQAVTTPD